VIFAKKWKKRKNGEKGGSQKTPIFDQIEKTRKLHEASVGAKIGFSTFRLFGGGGVKNAHFWPFLG